MLDSVSRNDYSMMRDILDDLILDRFKYRSEFLRECSCCASYLRPRKGELGFNPYVKNFITITNHLKVKPSEVCMMCEGKIKVIPRRCCWDTLNVGWEDIASTVREYVDIRMKIDGSISERLNHSKLCEIARLSDKAYGHRVRLLSLYDVVSLMGGCLSEFFLLLEGDSVEALGMKRKACTS